MRRSFPQSIFAVLAAPVLFFAASASAAPSADSCGNIALVATGECHLEVTGGCEAKCTPLTLQAACDGQCTGSIDASCNASCNVDCDAHCNVNPGSFSCEADCKADCGGSCMANCNASQNHGDCTAYCEQSCTGRCQGECHGVPPSADCKAKCGASCEGSCTAQANFDCSYMCSSSLQGGCTAACKEPNGALFCTDQNGVEQFVHVNNLDECEAYLAANFNVMVEASAQGTCNLNGCQGTGVAGIGCSTRPVGSAPLNVGAIATMVVGLGFVVSRRRRR